MATFDQLTPDQRAIIELLLRQDKSYDELAGLLGISESRVRDLAREALMTLAPVTADQVDADWRGQLADYVLGQQSGPESTATRGHLRRSEAARAWTRSLLDSLEHFYDGNVPTIPDAERGAGRRRRAQPAEPEPEPVARRELSPEARAALRRRRLVAGLAGLAVLAALAVLVWPVGVLTGDDDEGGAQQTGGPLQQPAAGSGKAAGIAVVAERGGQRQVIVQAASLPPNRQREAYEVWLYNSPKDAKSLGAQVTDARGTYQGAGPLPSDYRRYRFIDVSREPIDQDKAHSGQSVLRGRIGELKKPKNVRKGQAAILGQIVLTPPRGQ